VLSRKELQHFSLEMNKMSNSDESFGYLVFGASVALGLMALFLSLALSLSESGTDPLTPFIAFLIFATVIAIAVGVRGRRRGGSKATWRKSRLAAMLMAWAPGRGHVYLDRPREGIKFLVTAVVGMTVTLATVPLHEPNIVIYGFVIMLFSVTWSCIDVNRICDEMGLPYTESIWGGEFEMHFKRSDILEVLLFALMGLALFFIGHSMATNTAVESHPDEGYIAIFNCVAPLFPIAIAAKYAAIHMSKRRKSTGDR
jgi:hypothetical protein